MDEQAIRASERARIVQELENIPYWSNDEADGFDVGFGPDGVGRNRTWVIDDIRERMTGTYLDEMQELDPVLWRRP